MAHLHISMTVCFVPVLHLRSIPVYFAPRFYDVQEPFVHAACSHWKRQSSKGRFSGRFSEISLYFMDATANCMRNFHAKLLSDCVCLFEFHKTTCSALFMLLNNIKFEVLSQRVKTSSYDPSSMKMTLKKETVRTTCHAHSCAYCLRVKIFSITRTMRA